MDNNSDEQFLVMCSAVDENSKAYDDKIKAYYSKLDKKDSKLDKITPIIKNMVYQNQNYNSLPGNMYSKKSQDSITVIPANKKDPTLED